VSETVLRREVDIDLLDKRLNINKYIPSPYIIRITSSTAYILLDIQELPAEDYAL
jgi:hypothetical protein